MSIPSTMQAFVLAGHGDFDQLQYHTDWPVPACGDQQVLIKVHACGLNNTDINTRTAWYSKGVTSNTTGGSLEDASGDDATWGGKPLEFPRIQGADVSGTVVATGAGVKPGLVGKRVMIDTWLRDWSDPTNYASTGYYGSECDGGYADYTVIDHHHVHVVESSLSDTEIACFATSYITAENMLSKANVGKGDHVLITGASGGVGSALIQLAKRRGALTIALCGESKHQMLQALSPDVTLVREPESLKAALKQATGRDEVDVVADVVGGSYFPTVIDAIARGGRYTCAGAIAGPMVEFDLRTFYLKDLIFTGATVVPVGMFSELVGYIERNEIKPVVAKAFELTELHDAQRMFIAKQHIGNIVVTTGSTHTGCAG
ncbi:MAG: zinc-binding dehydrogenase [Pseudomonadota bacterium]